MVSILFLHLPILQHPLSTCTTGNGTQRVVRNVNDDETQNQRLGMYFGSIHDIDKYPCDVSAPGAFRD